MPIRKSSSQAIFGIGGEAAGTTRASFVKNILPFRRLMKRLNPKIAGKIRTIPVYVGNSKGYRECLKPELIREELRFLFVIVLGLGLFFEWADGALE